MGDNITLNMPGNITFKSGSSELDPSFFKVLNSVNLVVKKYNKTVVSRSLQALDVRFHQR